MKVLALTRYAALGASSRLRFLQYLPALAAAHIDVQVCHLLDDAYLHKLYSEQKRSMRSLATAYLRRMKELLKLGNYDLLWIEKECFPGCPATVERLLSTLGMPFLVDYDDAVFHSYDMKRSTLYRVLLGKKIDVVMRSAAAVTAGSAYLESRARAAGARRVMSLPTVVDLDRYPERPETPSRDIVTIGWIGSPSTAHYLDAIRESIERLLETGKVRFLVVGALVDWVVQQGGQCRPWSEDREYADVCEMDIGLMPLLDDPWARGKCGYKLIQYMACGVPVVASPVGANCQIVAPGRSGFLPGDSHQWGAALSDLVASPELRMSMGKAGREAVRRSYCVQQTAPALIQLMRELV